MKKKTQNTTDEPLTKKELQEQFQSLINSCHEGYSGEWDCIESRGGFVAMAESIAYVASKLGVEVTVPEFNAEDCY